MTETKSPRGLRAGCEQRTSFEEVEATAQLFTAALDLYEALMIQIRREALKDAQRIAVRIMREEEAHGGDIARERAGAAEEIADEIEALITGGDDE